MQTRNQHPAAAAERQARPRFLAGGLLHDSRALWNLPPSSSIMSNSKRAIARLREEKEARNKEGIRLLNDVNEGITALSAPSLDHEQSQQSLRLAVLLEKAKRACVLLEHHPDYFRRARAHSRDAAAVRFRHARRPPGFDGHPLRHGGDP